MSTNFIDVLMMWVGIGPSSPKYCALVTKNIPSVTRFGDPLGGGGVSNALTLRVPIGGRLASPTNALIWYVPDLAGLSEEERGQLKTGWPPLRELDGSFFTPEKARGDGTHDSLLLEVFPQAFRRLEFLFSSLEIPTSIADWDIPRVPTPRWFWISAFGEAEVRSTFKAIAEAQLAGAGPVTIDGFMKGLAPIYVDAGQDLGGAFDSDEIAIRAFDGTGLPIDPEFVFATFNRLATDSDFESLLVPHPQGDPYDPAPRHVVVFCDQDGLPYTPRPAPTNLPPPTDPDAGVVEAERRLRVLTAPVATLAFPEHGVLVTQPNDGLHARTGAIGLALTGTHVRLGTYPHGTQVAAITVDFALYSFLRLQVLDYGDWFPRSPNPLNRLARYTEGNLITPLIDGAAFFHELYRIIRGTYKNIDPTAPAEAFDPDAPVDDGAPGGVSKAKVLLSNAWIDPHTPLLGRRGMLATPKTQDVLPEELPSFELLKSKMRFVAVAPLPRQVDLATLTPDELQWWMVSDEAALPPGASVELRQLMFADTFRGDDPRLPEVVLNADIFGIVAPFHGAAASSRGFVSTTGRFVLPVVFARGREPMATLRITVWPDDASGPAARNYGEVLLPVPDDPITPASFDGPANARRIRLLHEGVPGTAVVVLDAGALREDQAVVIVNPRSGEVLIEEHTANGDVLADSPHRIELTGFALQDSALVGFLPPGATNPAECTHFFDLYLGRVPEVPDASIDGAHAHPGNAAIAALQAGMAPAHPTEIAGLLREAITAGVDVRLLAWKDSSKHGQDDLLGTLGMVNAVNATRAGRRGQAIHDGTTRETFHVHHQKGAFIRTASLDVTAFVGGIDILVGRWDTPAHRQPDPERPGTTWHDVHCKVEGRAVWDVYRNFMERWNAADALPDIVGADIGRTPLPPPDDPSWGPTPVVDDPAITKADGPHAAQILRTLTPHFDAYGGSAPPFNIVEKPTGDLSVRNTWLQLLGKAERYLYIEDQYFWIEENALDLHRWLRGERDRFVFLVIPRRFSDINIGDQIHYALRRRCLSLLLCGIPDLPVGTAPETIDGDVVDQVAMFHIVSRENLDPIYVHSKVVIADDTWFTIGSANLSRRSWTFDSEINVACIDTRLRRGGHQSARQLRVDLLAEHLQLSPVETPLLDDPRAAFRLVMDVLKERRSWMRTHLRKVEFDFTHYGPFPPGFDPILRDAVDKLVDVDGLQHFDFGLIDLYDFKRAISDGPGGFQFGGLGRLRFTFDVSGLGMAPGDVIVLVEMRDEAWPASQRVAMGPFPAAALVEAGLLLIHHQYTVKATALAVATSSLLATAEKTFDAVDFLNTVELTF